MGIKPDQPASASYGHQAKSGCGMAMGIRKLDQNAIIQPVWGQRLASVESRGRHALAARWVVAGELEAAASVDERLCDSLVGRDFKVRLGEQIPSNQWAIPPSG
jgi:hypothetical protein